jgi:signal transduction histidine kinase
LLVGGWSSVTAADTAIAIEISKASFLKSDAPSLPPESAPWQAQPLPDSWRESRPDQQGYGWYKASFTLPAAPQGLQAIYISFVNSAYTAYVNGVEVADSGGMDDGSTRRSGGFPQWITVPPEVVHAGVNEFALRLRVASNLRGGLTAPILGSKDAIAPLYRHDLIWRSVLPQALNTAMLALGALALLLWSRHRTESVYGWFGAFLMVTSLWVLRNFNDALLPMDVPARAWETFVLAGHGVGRLLMLMFVLRYTAQQRPRLERFLMLAIPLLPLVLFAAGEGAMSHIRTVFYAASGWPSWYCVYLLARYSPWRIDGGARLVLAAAAGSELLAVHDWLIALNALPFGTVQWQNYGSALLMLAMTAALAGRYFAAFATARTLNSELERRVAQKTTELEANYRKVADYERAATLDEERRRLMRDMHDGIGSQLITAASVAERGQLEAPELARMLRECIDDLRLVIDSLEPDHEDLALALASLRWRLAPRLQAAGLVSHWDLDGLPAGLALGPAQVLAILRIVQEALTNVIKHAGARQVSLRASSSGQGIELSLLDDGFTAAAQLDAKARAPRGRGLANMRRRAQDIGATLELAFTPTGASVVLRLSLEPSGS